MQALHHGMMPVWARWLPTLPWRGYGSQGNQPSGQGRPSATGVDQRNRPRARADEAVMPYCRGQTFFSSVQQQKRPPRCRGGPSLSGVVQRSADHHGGLHAPRPALGGRHRVHIARLHVQHAALMAQLLDEAGTGAQQGHRWRHPFGSTERSCQRCHRKTAAVAEGLDAWSRGVAYDPTTEQPATEGRSMFGSGKYLIEIHAKNFPKPTGLLLTFCSPRGK